jgi:selenocysteine-specific elongation factor
VIIGTAGHIDHGKSALVEALTGRRMDRLAEERARGITIDLNFAPLRVAEGVVAGVVDVPGHEAFVRTMVAGAAGMDLVLLVIAADEGIMPQTREHLAIVEALGVPRGIPVLTKCDLASPDWLALVREEVDAWLSVSAVQMSPALPVSVRTGEGIEELRRLLGAEVARVRPRDVTESFRMPVDRAFSVAGTGTVVTGSVWSGAIGVGDQVRLLPSERPARIRTIEVHGERCEWALSGHRAALGLANINRDAVGRGDAVVGAGLPWEATTVLDVRVRLLADAPRPLTARTRVHLHLGTAGVVARVLPRAPIAPGDSGLARLACEAPLVARGGDRFVIRNYSPLSTIGGGMVLDPLPPRRRPTWPGGLDSPEATVRVRALLTRHPAGVSSEFLALRAGLTPADVVRVLSADESAHRLPNGWATTLDMTQASARAMELLSAYHAGHPSLSGMPVETLRRGVHRSVVLAEAVVEGLVSSGAVLVGSGVARLAGFEAGIAGGDAAVDRVIELIQSAGFGAPPIPELERQLERIDVTAALRIGAGTGRVEAVSRDWYLGSGALEEFRVILAEAGRAGDISVAAIRDRTGLTRKYLIPLLEWADRKGITRRVGEARRLT